MKKQHIELPQALADEGATILVEKNELEAQYAANKHNLELFWLKAEKQFCDLGLVKNPNQFLTLDYVRKQFYIVDDI